MRQAEKHFFNYHRNCCTVLFFIFGIVRKKSAIILAWFLPFQVLVIQLLSQYPQFIEDWYSKGLYPFFSSALRLTLGILPFSLGDLLYALLIILVLRWLTKVLPRQFRRPRIWIPECLAVLSLIYLLFNLFWGLNYYRLPLHHTLNIEAEYSTEDLAGLTAHLVEESNRLQLDLTGDDSTMVEIPYSKTRILQMAMDGYRNIDDRIPELHYRQRSLKKSLYSLPLTYMGFNGYLNPLTNEGQVNIEILRYRLPTTASHEIGHQLGFAKENESNFLACLTTMNHPDPYFRYSGYTFALSYCLSELFRRDPDGAQKAMEGINYGIQLNYLKIQEFWEAHHNPMEPVFMSIYNSFLIANNQPEGMRSYSYVVALLVNYHKAFGGITLKRAKL